MTSSFLAVGLIIASAAAAGALARNFKQPLILAYILVGVIAASLGVFQTGEIAGTIDFLAELGIAFLLFLIGLELNISEIRHLGRISFITGIGQILFTGTIGFLLSLLLGFGTLEAIYISIALTFSSTVIVVKLLSEKRDLNSLYGKVSIGFLLVQDVVAILALILIASIGVGEFSAGNFVLTLVEGLVFVVLTYALSRYVAPAIFDGVGKSTELLFLSSIAWVMVFSSVAVALGFSVEIGSFLAGVGLSSLKQEYQIASRIRPLRDLFVVIFFISLGLQLSFNGIISNLVPAILFSLFVLIGNPLIMLFIMGRLGFRKRTSFLSSLTLAQISEFSLVVVALGAAVGHIGNNIVGVITLVGVITISVSSYLILYSSKIYSKFGKYIPSVEGKEFSEKIFEGEKEFSDHVVLVGAGRLGSEILDTLRKNKKEVLVVDFDPSTVRSLLDREFDVVFGDIADKDIVDKANVRKAKLLISTVHDSDDTDDMINILKTENIHTPVVTTAADAREALKFYQKGVSYVIIPRILSSEYVSLILDDENIDNLLSDKLREKHVKELREKASK